MYEYARHILILWNCSHRLNLGDGNFNDNKTDNCFCIMYGCEYFVLGPLENNPIKRLTALHKNNYKARDGSEPLTRI